MLPGGIDTQSILGKKQELQGRGAANNEKPFGLFEQLFTMFIIAKRALTSPSLLKHVG